MKYLLKWLFVGLAALFLFSNQARAQSIIDTNFTTFKTIYLAANGQTNLVLDTNMYRTHKDSVYFTQTLFTCADLNDSVLVGLTITDTSVTPAQTYYAKSVDFWTVDTVAPFLVLHPLVNVYLKPNGTAKLLFADVDNGSWDSCGVSTSGFEVLTQTDFFCSDIGLNSIQIKVPDFRGNIRVGSTTVNVIDTLKPNISLVADTLYLSGNPLAAQIQFADINNGSSDNCGLDSATLNGSSLLNYSCGDVGLNKVVVDLYDINGNVATDSISFYVMDTLGFNYTKNPFTAYLSGDSAAVYSDSILTIIPGGCASPVLAITSDTIFTCADISANPNYISFTLTSGPITIVDSVEITVLDTICPTLSLRTDTFYFTTSGLDISFVEIDNGSSDNCTLDSATINGLATASFACGDTGAQNLTVVLYDQSGNASVGQLGVYLLDTLTPTYTKTPFTAYLQGSSVTVSRVDVISSLSGGCNNNPQFSFVSDTLFTCADIALSPVYVKFTVSTTGNAVLDSVPVTVLDTLAPQLVIQQTDTLYVGGTPLSASLTFADLDVNTTDNCGIDSATVNGQSQLTFSCADTGMQEVVVHVWDVNGNASTDTSMVYVLDTIQPTYTKHPQTIYVHTGTAVVYVDSLVKNLTGGCNVPTLTIQSDTVFDCLDITSNPNYIRFNIASGTFSLTDSVAITVLDTVKPTLALQSDTLVMGSNGYTLTFADIDAGSLDNCGIDSAQVNGSNAVNFTCADTGLANIQVVLYDVNGNSQTDSVNVYVIDTLGPGYTKVPFTAYLQSNSIAVSRADVLTNVTGGCGSSLSVTLLSDTVFTCADVNSNPHYVSFSIVTPSFSIIDSVPVTVLDTLAPQLVIQQTDTLYVGGTPLSASLTFADLDVNTTDNCGIDSATVNGQSQLTFSCSDTGMQEVIVHVWDVNGNASTDTSVVYVLDTIQPTYTKHPQTVYVHTGTAVVYVDSLVKNLTGGCNVPTLTIQSDTVFDCLDITSNPNYIRFNIASGTFSLTDSVAITVLDTVKPTLALQSDTLVMGSNGYTLTFADIDAGSLDNCGIDSAQVNGSNAVNFTCADTGLANIQVVLYDVNGNSQTDSVNVYVIDTLGPGYTKVPFTAYLQSNSIAVSRADILTNVTGGCGSSLSVTLLSDTVFTCADVNSNPHYVSFSIVTPSFSVIDSVPVTVLDTLSPQLAIQQTDTLYLGGTPLSASLTFADLDVNTTDNCGIDSATVNGQSQLTFSCADTGMQEVIVHVWDVNGNASTDTSMVYVLDTIQPTYTKHPQTVYVHTGTAAVYVDSLVKNLTGGCNVPTLTIQSDTVFDCLDITSNPNYIRFNIVSGTFSLTDSVAITVLDTVKPTLALQSDTLVMGSNGYTLTFADIDAGSLDNCGIDSAQVNGSNAVNFTCADTGLANIQVVLYDVNGNSQTGSVNVYIIDTLGPGYTKVPFTAYLQSNSIAVSRADILTNVTGGCGSSLSVTLLSDTVFTCADVNSNPHYVSFSIVTPSFSVIDSVPVTALDTLAPQLVIQQTDTLYVGGTPLSASLTFADLDVNTTDNCGIDSATVNGQSQLTFSCADTGMQEVIVHVWDVNGNASTDTSNVYVLDTISPSYVKVPQTVYLQGSTVSVFLDSVITNVEGGCTEPIVTALSDTIFDCFDITSNPNYIHFNVTNGILSLTDSVAITVLDTVKPLLNIPTTDTLLIYGTSLTLTFADLDLGSSDNCALDFATLNGLDTLQFGCGDVGVNLIAVNLFDINGNMASGSINLYIQDTISPSYTKTPHAAYLIGDSVTISRNDILDNVGGGCSGAASLLTILSDTTFNCTDVFSNPNWVQFSVTAGGFTILDSVSVTVIDTVSPTFSTKPPQTVYLDSAGQRKLLASDLLNGLPQDNCGIDSVLITPSILDCSNTGQFAPVAVQVFDVHGNSTTKFMFVLALDSTAPAMVVLPTTVYLDSATGLYALQQTDIVQSVSDNCGLQSVTFSPNIFGCTDTGLVNVVVTATDVNANSNSTTVAVMVRDTMPPILVPVSNHSVFLDATGSSSLSLQDLLITPPFDACGIADTLITQTQFNCADVGTQNLFLKLVDGNGNADSANIQLTVVDTIFPTLIVKAISITLDAFGSASITAADVVDTVYDNCSVNALTLSQNTFSCADVGIQNVTVSAIDQSGNLRVRNVFVTVIGPTSGAPQFSGPTAVCVNNTARYVVDNPDNNSTYKWNIQGGNVLATAYAGRAIFVQWGNATQGSISVKDEFATNCFSDSTLKNITISGLAPDTAKINYWDPSMRITLVTTDLNANYYQWGYDRWVNNTLVSDTLTGEIKTSYTNTNMPNNIDVLGYVYWCQTSFNGVCWTRSYHNQLPIGIEDEELKVNLTIWPNPIHDWLEVSSSKAIDRVELYDLSGKLLFLQEQGADVKEVRMSDLEVLPPSTYVLKISLHDGTIVNRKLIRVE